MKRFGFGARRTLVLLMGALCLLLAAVAFAQRPMVTLKNGHISPVMARVTYADGKTQDVMITKHFWGDTHQYQGENASGGVVNLWLDSISSINDPDDSGVNVVLKNGSQRHLGWHGGTQTFTIANEDGGTENIDIQKVSKIEFLKAPRKDSLGNAMFDNWKYSPFTGEKLPVK